VRALTGAERDGAKPIAKTDKAMGLVREFVPANGKPSAVHS